MKNIKNNNKLSKISRKIPSKPTCGRYLRTIYFYITEGCNLRCRHCWINPPYENEKNPKYPFVDLKLFKHIVDQGIELGLSSVKLTGGEPLIHPEIDKVIEYVHEKNLRLNIETNGVSLTPKLAKLIISSRIRGFLSISIDSHIPETHDWIRNVKGAFEGAIRGVKSMTDAGRKPQIIMSVMKKNAGDVEGLVKLAESIGAGSVKFNLVSPTARGETLHDQGETLSIEELFDLGKFVNEDLQPRSKIRLIYSYPAAFRSVRNIRARPNIRGCGIFNIIGVLGSGNYALCGIGQSLPDFVWGDASIDSLKDIWNNTPMLNKIREGLPSKLRGICSDCLMRKGCLGSCIANNYYAYGELFASHSFCELAYEAGIFPKSRLIPGSKYEVDYVEKIR